MPPESGRHVKRVKKVNLPKSIAFRICVYPSSQQKTLLVAHCLELDVIGLGECVESALTELLENIDTQRDVCQRTGAQFFMPAPEEVWKKYRWAYKARRKIPGELTDRVITQANKRLGHKVPEFQDVLASRQVPDEFLAPA